MASVQPVRRKRRRAWSTRVGLAVAVPLLLAACGKSANVAQSSNTATTTTVTSTHTVTSTTATSKTSTSSSGGASGGSLPSKQQALAYVKAVNLRASDLPGYTSKPKEHEKESSEEKHASQRFLGCLVRNLGDLGKVDKSLEGTAEGGADLAEAGSPEFQRQTEPLRSEMVQSFVLLMRSATLPGIIARAFRAKGAEGCLSSFVRADFGAALGNGLRLGSLALHEIAAPANAFGWRVISLIRYRSVTIPFEMDLLGFSTGRTFVLVFTVGLSQRFDPQVERHVVTTLMKRAKSEPL